MLIVSEQARYVPDSIEHMSQQSPLGVPNSVPEDQFPPSRRMVLSKHWMSRLSKRPLKDSSDLWWHSAVQHGRNW